MAAWWLHTIRTLESLIVAIKFVFEVKERERERTTESECYDTEWE